MAKICEAPKVDLKLTFVIDEDEARALEALAGYGVDQFVAAFYEKLGKGYMERHEQGLRSFLESINAFVPRSLGKIDRARKAFDGSKNDSADVGAPS